MDLEAEAAEKAAELRQRRDIKDRARDVLDSEAQAHIEDERAAFRRDLRDAIKLPPQEAADQIENLCNRYGRTHQRRAPAQVQDLPVPQWRQAEPRGEGPRSSTVRSSRSCYSGFPCQRASPHGALAKRSTKPQ